MPGFDGTGPRGTGPMTGGGRGFCVLSGTGPIGRPAEFAAEQHTAMRTGQLRQTTVSSIT
jgi:hypothetical protein